ncbi:MAG TPA: SCO family protein, partial [Steroidobacteraceae bacterium]|nr:SCO family protein [Steroidobacteraceae bacterium]
YTSCAFICPMITTRLKQVSELAAEALGTNSFTVLTIGFDTAVDTPDRMRDYARARRIDAPNWHFVSADAETVAAMSHDLGFQFVPLAGGFDHLAQVSVLDAQSRVYAQIYGPEFDTPALIDPLKRLSLGANVRERPLAEVLRKARLLCTTFDPKTGRYSFDYSLIMEIVIGFTITLSIGGWWLHSWRHR